MQKSPETDRSPARTPAAGALPPAPPGFGHVNRYWDPTRGCMAAKILPGEYYVTGADEVVVTVLGSCVAACIRDARTGVGGMNHFMLPLNEGGDDNWSGTSLSTATRYGNVAMEYLINEVLKHGSERRRLEVKVFGGGRILREMTDIGRRNIEFVLDYVETEGLRLIARDLGGDCPRKVVYHPGSGRVQVKKLQSLRNETVLEREAAYMDELVTQPVEGSVDLF